MVPFAHLLLAPHDINIVPLQLAGAVAPQGIQTALLLKVRCKEMRLVGPTNGFPSFLERDDHHLFPRTLCNIFSVNWENIQVN